MLRVRADELARSVAGRLEGHQVAEPMMAIVGAKRASAMVAAVFPLIIEALEGGNQIRQTYLDMIVPASAMETEVSVLVHEGYRMWLYLLPDLVGRLPENFQGPASSWLADFMTDWMREVEVRALAVRSGL